MHPNIPLFLAGHSMGGGVALTYAYSGTHRDKLAGVFTWSPLVDVAPAVRPPGFVVAAGRIAAKFFPNQKIVQKLDASFMSRDRDVCREFAKDPLCHSTGTLLGLAEMLDRGQKLRSPEVEKKFPEALPILVCHGTGDKITDCTASRRFVEALQINDKTFKEYEGWYHKMHAEPGEDRVQFANYVIEWIKERCSSSPTMAASTSKLWGQVPSMVFIYWTRCMFLHDSGRCMFDDFNISSGARKLATFVWYHKVFTMYMELVSFPWTIWSRYWRPGLISHGQTWHLWFYYALWYKQSPNQKFEYSLWELHYKWIETIPVLRYDQFAFGSR